jgi:hypothetical protein
METLSKIDAVPFEPEAVERYKKRMLKQNTSLFVRWNWKKDNINGLGVASIVLGVVSILITVICVIVCIKNHRWSNFLHYGIWVELSCLASFFTTVYQAEKSYKSFSWDSTPIKGYRNPIPEFVLGTALNVKEVFPQAVFYIQSFIERQSQVEDDPFLIAEIDNQRFYLEVWNEPGFEKKRIV